MLIITSLRKVILQLPRYFKDHTFILSGHKYTKNKQVHIASYQTLKNRKDVDLNQYKFIIFEEVHIYRTSKLFKDLFELNVTKLGVTGTPLTNTNKIIPDWDNWIQTITLREAIKQNYSAPLRFLSRGDLIEKYKSDLSTRKQDYDQETIRRIVSKERLLELIKEHIIDNEVNTKHKAILLLPFIENADTLYEELKHLPNVFKIHSNLPEKEQVEILETFKKTPKALILGIRSITTGLDFPDADYLILGILTKIHSLLLQAIGRVSRIDPNNKNKIATIVDMTGNLQGEGALNPYTDFSEYKEAKPKCKEECLEIYKEGSFDYEICVDSCETEEVLVFCGKPPARVKEDPYAVNYQKHNDVKPCKEGSPVWNWKFKTLTNSNEYDLDKYSKCPKCGVIYKYTIQTLKGDIKTLVNPYSEESDLPTAYIVFNKALELAYVLIENDTTKKFDFNFVRTRKEALQYIIKTLKNKPFQLSSNISLKDIPNFNLDKTLDDWVELIDWENKTNKIIRVIIKNLMTEFAVNVGYKPAMVRFLTKLITKDNEKKVFKHLVNNKHKVDKTDFNHFRYDILKDKKKRLINGQWV